MKLMNRIRRRRLGHVLWVLVGVSMGLTLLVTTLRRHIELYQTPSELVMTDHRPVMLGGLVLQGSVQHTAPMTVVFQVTDFHSSIKVQYRGVLPALFREGQGVVMRGYVNAQGVFVARQVLAKHDENYRPPGVPDKPSSNTQGVRHAA